MARRESVSGPGDEDEEAFIRSMKRLREDRGWTQADLARKMTEYGWSGMYQTTISRIEKGERPVRIGEARGLATVFGVTVGMMIAQPESSKPVEALKNSVMKLDELKKRLVGDLEEHFVFAQMILPREIAEVEECGYESWADDDMKASIENFLSRARKHAERSVSDLVDEAMREHASDEPVPFSSLVSEDERSEAHEWAEARHKSMHEQIDEHLAEKSAADHGVDN